MHLLVNGAIPLSAPADANSIPRCRSIVFVHGAGIDHTVWALLARGFAHHGYAVLAPDLPGHGRSAGEPLASIAALADWIAALIDACQSGSARGSSVTPWDRWWRWKRLRGIR